jgi:hypothetical protein
VAYSQLAQDWRDPPGSVGVARDSDADSKRQNVHDQDDATAATVRGHEL